MIHFDSLIFEQAYVINIKCSNIPWSLMLCMYTIIHCSSSSYFQPRKREVGETHIKKMHKDLWLFVVQELSPEKASGLFTFITIYVTAFANIENLITAVVIVCY